jgi:general secretion pathway protein J
MTRRRRSRRGFTLIEALAALALGTLLFGLIAQFTGAWLGRWRDVVMVTSRQDAALVVLDRMADDIQTALPVFETTAQALTTRIDFDGTGSELTFVRNAVGFNPRPGLDRVTYRVGDSGGINALLRQRRDHADPDSAGEDLPLLRGDVRLSFTYFSASGTGSANWDDATRLPAAIRIDLASSTPNVWTRTMIVRLPSDWPPACGSARYSAECVATFR